MFSVLFSLSALAAAPLWPDLSSPPRVGGGERDAAVIVAIEDYAFVSDIPGAEQNGRDWYSYLTRGRGISPGRVKLLLNGQATKEEIEAAAAEMAGQIRSGGTMWFVFIGHGAPSADGREGLLLGADVNQTARSVYARGLRQADLLASLEGGQVQTIAVLDACFSGRDASGEELVSGLQFLIPSYASASMPSDALVLSAGRSDEFAGPLPGLGRPAFSYLALGALWGWGDTNQDRAISAQEVTDYTNDALRSVLVGRSQTPQLTVKDKAHGRTLVQGRQSGPDLAAIRLQLHGGAGIGVEGRSGALSDKLTQIQAMQAEEARLAGEKARLQRELDAEVARKREDVQAEANAMWKKVEPLAKGGGESGRQALESFIEEYDDVRVMVGDQRYDVEIDEVAQAQAMLERLGRPTPPHKGRGAAWTGVGVGLAASGGMLLLGNLRESDIEASLRDGGSLSTAQVRQLSANRAYAAGYVGLSISAGLGLGLALTSPGATSAVTSGVRMSWTW